MDDQAVSNVIKMPNEPSIERRVATLEHEFAEMRQKQDRLDMGQRRMADTMTNNTKLLKTVTSDLSKVTGSVDKIDTFIDFFYESTTTWKFMNKMMSLLKGGITTFLTIAGVILGLVALVYAVTHGGEIPLWYEKFKGLKP